MSDMESILDVKELEELCKLYMECKLSLFEERELQYVLSKYEGDNTIIMDVKKIMWFEVNSSCCQYQKKRSRYKLNFALKRITGIAASLILLCSFGIVSWFIYRETELNSNDVYCIVYSNGSLVSDKEEAVSIAEKNIKFMEEFENKMNYIQAKEEEKIDKFDHLTM